MDGNETSSTQGGRDVDLYTLLNVPRDAIEEDIQNAFKQLSISFHSDKLPPTTSVEEKEHIQELFLEIKRAKDVLADPVLRLVYDNYGDEGVELIRRIQQHQREKTTRREAKVQVSEDDDDDDEDNEDEDQDIPLYENLEQLLKSNPYKAKEELHNFMAQHDYDTSLDMQSQVQLACSVEFPPVVDLKSTYFHGRDYLNFVKQNLVVQARNAPSREDREYYQQRLKQEQSLVDYQINRVRDAQQGSVGFTLSSAPPRTVLSRTGDKVQPRWSMAVGTSTDRTYPSVAEVSAMVGKEKKNDEKTNNASIFINTVYQPLPDAQINFTANLTNDQSHQFILGSARTLSDRSSYRFSLTCLSKSPMDTNMILNLKSFRHIKDIGLASGGLSMGANGKFLQWHGKVEAVKGKDKNHKASAKVSIGMMQGNSLEFGYKLKTRKRSWIDEYLLLPKSCETTVVLGQFSKIEATANQQLTALASHPTLSFGFEHQVGLGCWNWIWELNFGSSNFRVPIPVLHLGTVTNLLAFYQQKVYYGIYCLLLQSFVAEILQDERENAHLIHAKNEESNKMKENVTKTKPKDDMLLQRSLMETVSERRRYIELMKDGLVIMKAIYFLEELGSGEYQIASMDATMQVQFWVINGRLALPAVPKSSLLGFYDLRSELRTAAEPSNSWRLKLWKRFTRQTVIPKPKEKPQLQVRYSYKSYVYEITVQDEQALVLPSEKARLLGHSGTIQ